MKKYVLFMLLISGLASFSQEDTTKNWTINGKASLNFSQSYFSNWSAGGESSLATIGLYTMEANYKKAKQNWSNWIDMSLGYNIIGGNDPMKTDDKIEIISNYGYELKHHLYFSTVMTFKTQFTKGYDYTKDSTNHISAFMAPAHIDLGPGIMYKPNEIFMLNLSPATGRLLVVNDQPLADAGAFGLEPAETDSLGNIITHAKKVKAEFGAKLLMTLAYEVFKNVKLGTKLELFSDYLDEPQNIDINWQVLLEMKVNGWLNVNITTEMLYDNDIIFKDANDLPIGPRTQFKQMLMVGIGLTF